MQSSAALLEKQRNPGVGYWQRSSENGSRTSMSSENGSRPASPAPTAKQSSSSDEEVNLEYLRNVILQFLEHKEMRVSTAVDSRIPSILTLGQPHLVRILSTILRFTPQETRRLISKV